MSAGEAWIRRRLSSAPLDLIERMAGAIPDGGKLPVAEELAEGAFSLYAEVVRGLGGREDALPLLAADALFTHAFQAYAEFNVDGIASFASRWSDRLQELEESV